MTNPNWSKEKKADREASKNHSLQKMTNGKAPSGIGGMATIAEVQEMNWMYPGAKMKGL